MLRQPLLALFSLGLIFSMTLVFNAPLSAADAQSTQALIQAAKSMEKAAQSLQKIGEKLDTNIFEAGYKAGYNDGFYAGSKGQVQGNNLTETTTSKLPSIEIDSLPAGVSKNIKQLLNTLKWETNTNFVTHGSKNAVRGGTLKYASSNYPPTLRPLGKNANTAFLSMVEGLCYEPLLSMDYSNFKYVPNLADKWGIASDKQSFFFHLDPKAKWMDGKPVIAQDFVATWKLRTDPDIEDPFENDYWGKYECPVAVSDSILMIKSKKSEWRSFMSAALSLIALPDHVIGGLSGKEFLEKYQFRMIPGSGPYTYESHKVNENLCLKRREDWWQDNYPKNIGLYNFSRIKFVFIEDENLLKEKFKKGDLDWFRVNVAREWHQEFIPGRLPQLGKGWIQKRKVYTKIPNGVSGVAFNIRTSPFNDARVRLAIGYLYNREKMMDKLFFNEYEFTDSLYPNSAYENPKNPKIRFNPDKAVELLEAAGWKQSSRNNNGILVKDGKPFILTMNYLAKSSERILTIFQEDLKDVGIELNLKMVTWATDIKEVGERNFKLSSRAYTGMLFPYPEGSLHSKFADKKHNNNIFGFKNKRVDELCDLYNLEFDPEKRTKMLQEIDGIIMNEHLWAYGWYAAHTRLLFWDKFGMPPFILSQMGDQRSIVEYWWFDKNKAEILENAIENDKDLPVGPKSVRWWDEYLKK